MKELADNINAQAGTQVQASINSDGKLTLSNTTGGTISVKENWTTSTNTYETGSGFYHNGASGSTGAYVDFTGFLKLDSTNGSPVRMDIANLGATTPGAMSELGQMGFRATTSQFSKGSDAYTVSGTALTDAGANTAWDQNALQINGTNIYNSSIATDTFQGKLDPINNFSDKTGVIAYANFDKVISISAANMVSTAGQLIKFNGTTVATTLGATQTATELAAQINTKTTATGITAVVSGNNIRLTGTNVQSLTITEATSANTTIVNLFSTSITSRFNAGIRLDSVQNKPISIALGDTQVTDSIGLLEQNVGAADFQINAPTLGVGSGASLAGLNVGSLDSATAAIGVIDNAIEKVSSARSKLGAMENRLNSVVENLTNIATNTSASRSRIQDTDYATETTALARSQIISQAATAMLAQANQQPQTVLSLLK